LQPSRAFARTAHFYIRFGDLRAPLPAPDEPRALGIRLAVKKLIARSKRDESKTEDGRVRILLLGLLLILPASGFAKPVDFDNPAPRWVEIAFEVSPRDRPGQIDTHYTPRIDAWLESVGSGQIRVTIDRGDVERILLADENPIEGSFSDFVWIFEAESGEVISATMSGELEKKLDWGLFDSKVRASIEVDMATRRNVGFKPMRRWMGQEFFSTCKRIDERRCTRVGANGYDPERGYVNAIGDLRVRFGDVVLNTFSPLGEAKLYEVDSSIAAAPAERAPVPALGAAFTAVGVAHSPAWVAMPAVSSGPPSEH
jgi:hypothetical protein